MDVHGEIAVGRGYTVRITGEEFNGTPRIDLRVWFEFRPGDPDTLQPTRKGVNLPVRQLPALRAALQRAEGEAIRCGRLRPGHYTDVGLPVPAELQPKVA